MAERARKEVIENWDMAVITRRLVDKYQEIVRSKRAVSNIIVTDD
jgi:hypothetical protein